MTQMEMRFEARKARDEGLDRADVPSLADELSGLLRVFSLRGDDFIGEDVRVLAESKGITAKPNAWGAAMMQLARRGVIEKTGSYRQMKTTKSHARESAVYRYKGGVNVLDG